MKTLIIGLGGFGKNLINDIKINVNDSIFQQSITKRFCKITRDLNITMGLSSHSSIKNIALSIE